jgi:transposase
MRRFIEGTDRQQSTLFPECLEDWICEDNPVRVIDVFVGGLDLADLRFDGVDPEATGRPSYHRSVLLKLYIYGYLNRVQSSRRLEREAGRNVEVMWLTGRLVPDHKTIADFRKDNGPAIRKVCAQFVALCRAIGLLTKASVAIDGSKFKAVNNRDKNFTRAKMERRLAQIEESVARYLSQLDTADLQEPSEALAVKTAHLKDKLAKLASEMDRLKAIERAMLASPDQQISLTDPDSRSMATSGRGSGVVGYNVQVAVDTEHHLIVTHEVTNTGSDRSQLAKVASQAKTVLGADRLDVVADRGYFNSPELLACAQADSNVAEADDIGCEVGWPLRQTRLRLFSSGGCIPLPGGREADLSVYERGSRQDAAPLLDDGLPALPAQGSLHDRTGATHHAMGARTPARSSAGASRCEPAGDARAPRDGRASLRHAQDADGSNPLSDEAPAQGCDRDGLARARLQSHASHEHHRGEASPGRNPGMRGGIAPPKISTSPDRS